MKADENTIVEYSVESIFTELVMYYAKADAMEAERKRIDNEEKRKRAAKSK